MYYHMGLLFVRPLPTIVVIIYVTNFSIPHANCYKLVLNNVKIWLIFIALNRNSVKIRSISQHTMYKLQ
jgi:hypothetical protein